MLIVASLSFLLTRLAPGDPFSASLDDLRVSADDRARLRAAYGLDRPLAEQYVRFLANLARGELGPSLSHHRPAADVLREAVPHTLLLMGAALALSIVLGIGVAVWQAGRRGRAADRLVDGASLTVAALPDFWLATVLMLTLAYWLPVFPAGGTVQLVMHDSLSPAGRVLDRLRHLALPAATLTLIGAATIARYQRAALADVLPREYVRAARAKGVSERDILRRHALRNAILPVIAVLGLTLPALLGGAVFVERVFAWPGMGRVAVDAFAARDYPVVVGAAMLGGALVVVGGILADVLHALADPRVRAR